MVRPHFHHRSSEEQVIRKSIELHPGLPNYPAGMPNYSVGSFFGRLRNRVKYSAYDQSFVDAFCSRGDFPRDPSGIRHFDGSGHPVGIKAHEDTMERAINDSIRKVIFVFGGRVWSRCILDGPILNGYPKPYEGYNVYRCSEGTKGFEVKFTDRFGSLRMLRGNVRRLFVYSCFDTHTLSIDKVFIDLPLRSETKASNTPELPSKGV